jgi:hypothetical protein
MWCFAGNVGKRKAGLPVMQGRSERWRLVDDHAAYGAFGLRACLAVTSENATRPFPALKVEATTGE